jgi:hypothetical protein
MTFEEAGKVIDDEITRLVEFVDKKVKPSTRQEMSQLLKKAAEKLSKLAESVEKTSQ